MGKKFYWGCISPQNGHFFTFCFLHFFSNRSEWTCVGLHWIQPGKKPVLGSDNFVKLMHQLKTDMWEQDKSFPLTITNENSHTRPFELECRHTYYIVMITMDYDHQFIIREMIKLWSKCVHSTPSNLPILFAHTQQFVFMLLGYPPLIWRILINGLFKWFHFPINSPPPTLWASCRLIFSLFSSPPRAQGSVTWWIKFHPSNSIIFPPIIAICIFPASHGEGNASLVDETTEKG